MAKRNRAGSLALGGLFLAGIGYVAGILTAPKSGKETRQDIQRTMSRAKAEAEKKLKLLNSDLSDLLTRGKQTAKTASATAKKELDRAIDKAQQAREKVRMALSALHEGESADEDLEQAIKEAKKAADSLKKYVSKNAKTKKA